MDGNRLARRRAIAAPHGSMVRNAAQAGGVEPRPYAGQDGFRKNVIPRSEAAWGYYGLPHQPAGWFAMTCLLGGGVCQARQEMIFSG